MIGLVAEQLTIARGGCPLIAGISATIPASAMTVLVGPNGAGKSTLLRALAGVERPASGRALVTRDAQPSDLHALPPEARARLLAWVPAHSALPFAFTVRETVLMGRYPWHLGAPKKPDLAAADAALDHLGILSLAPRRVTALSSGEQQKVLIARALAGDAPVLLLDEPLAPLDVGAGLRLLALLARLAAAGRTVVLTLHDLALAYRFPAHALCLHRGSLAAAGTPAAVFTPQLLRDVFGVTAAVTTTPSGPRLQVEGPVQRP